MIRVILADDHPQIVQAIAAILIREPDIQVVGTAKNGLEALELIQENNPDVVVIDIEMPVLTGIQVIQFSKQRNHPVSILALSGYDDIQFILSVFASGASGYLVKDDVSDCIIQAVREAAEGNSPVFSPRVAEKIAKWQH